MANEDDDEDDDDDENEMGWSAEDEEEFRTVLDKDGDGILNRDEIYHWLIPDDFDHIVDESNHLFTEADEDKVSQHFAAQLFKFHYFFRISLFLVFLSAHEMQS